MSQGITVAVQTAWSIYVGLVTVEQARHLNELAKLKQAHIRALESIIPSAQDDNDLKRIHTAMQANAS